ncbi:unnamed protein product [Durusdinium trenchii]|uniref:Uncharacterized protein n=1 Tax=Durusdinium trenchii TaxID=1381693 RepID=A0ABP0H806_9DINO
MRPFARRTKADLLDIQVHVQETTMHTCSACHCTDLGSSSLEGVRCVEAACFCALRWDCSSAYGKSAGTVKDQLKELFPKLSENERQRRRSWRSSEAEGKFEHRERKLQSLAAAEQSSSQASNFSDSDNSS